VPKTAFVQVITRGRLSLVGDFDSFQGKYLRLPMKTLLVL